MSDTHSAIIAAMREQLERHYAKTPNAIPVAVPLGALADAAVDVQAGGRPVPRVPVYDPEVALKRAWTGMLDPEQLGEGFTSLGARITTDGYVEILVKRDDREDAVKLNAVDAIEFALSVIAAAYAARGES